jgi:hypothetical protein
MSAASRRPLILLAGLWFLGAWSALAQEWPGRLDTSRDRDSKMLEFRRPTEPPSFLGDGRPVPWVGLYFGVGLRDVELKPAELGTVRSAEALSNGAGFNLGFFWDRQSIEYTRQASFLEVSAGTAGTERELEVEQHTLWWNWFPLRWKQLHAHAGAGLQASRARFNDVGRDYQNELAAEVGTGVALFPSRNLMLMYRASYSQRVVGLSDEEPFLERSQLHTLFFNYYFSL